MYNKELFLSMDSVNLKSWKKYFNHAVGVLLFICCLYLLTIVVITEFCFLDKTPDGMNNNFLHSICYLIKNFTASSLVSLDIKISF